MTLTFVVGDMGSGKTLFMTALSKLTNDRPIYSNYHIDHENFVLLKPHMLSDLPAGSLVLIDEAYVLLESRTSGKRVNRYMSYILFQSRKRGLDMVLSMQLTRSIDVRYRSLANYLVRAKKSKRSFIYDVYKISEERYPMLRFNMPFSYAEKIYPFYDTDEMVPLFDEDLEDLIDESTILPKIDLICDTLVDMYGKKAYKMNKPAISDYCLEYELPARYSEYIFNRLQRRSIDMT